MPSANLLTGSHVASFKGIELNHYPINYTDARKPRLSMTRV